MAYVPFHKISFTKTQQPVTVGRPTPVPNNTKGNVLPRIFSKLQPHNFPVVKSIIRRQVNT